MIVDDTAINRDLLARRLTRRMFNVVQADSGRGALDLIASETFDLVLLDVVMPDIGGLDVLRAIRASYSPMQLPVMMVTGRSESENIVEALSLGANDYVTKPIDFAVVFARMETQIGRKRTEEKLWRAHADLRGINETLHANVADLERARDQAESANRAKSQFLANMSHEIRTPLNGVLGMAQIMDADDLSTIQRQRLGVVRRSGEALMEILNDVLDVSKIEAGMLRIEEHEFDVDELITSLHASFLATAQQKNLRFDYSISQSARGLRLGDAARLRQIISNFVSNAIRFTESGGLYVGVTMGEGEESDRLVFSVRDTGVGIPKDKVGLLFERFVQVDSSSTRAFGGTGLGLAIASELARLMGGRVGVESTLGEGSTFFAVLPLARSAAAAPAQAPLKASPAAASTTGRLRILAAEDNATNQLVLTSMVELFGYSLVVVGDGREAVAAWSAEAFDLILMDIHMPNMDGVAATREIRAREAATGRARTPIVAVTANALSHQIKDYFDAGMDQHVAKPIEIPKLRAGIAAAMAAAPAAMAGPRAAVG